MGKYYSAMDEPWYIQGTLPFRKTDAGIPEQLTVSPIAGEVNNLDWT